jgi:hypothetical protein
MPATIPGNALQMRLHELQREAKRGDAWGLKSALGVLIEVYDPDSKLKNGLPTWVQNRMLEEPGLVWAKVRLLASDMIGYYWFEYSDEEVLSQNSAQLIGRKVKIYFTGASVQFGMLRLFGRPDSRRMSLKKSIQTADIGDLL